MSKTESTEKSNNVEGDQSLHPSAVQGAFGIRPGRRVREGSKGALQILSTTAYRSRPIRQPEISGLPRDTYR